MLLEPIEDENDNKNINNNKILLLFETQNKFNNEINKKIKKITDTNDTNLLININNNLLSEINKKIDNAILFFGISIISFGILIVLKKN